ncbi:MAG TPA: hypothetical protein PLO57_07510 [Candidatus Cloacimonadota bacterium]|nr:hypothetical protein [Candidatus Cloacimonadota bacterium]
MNSVALWADGGFINFFNTCISMIVQYKRRHSMEARRDQWQLKIMLYYQNGVMPAKNPLDKISPPNFKEKTMWRISPNW